jgi:Holliday junction DNA helicase RuvA
VIASVRGEVLVRRPDHVVIEAGGVGYRLAVSAETLKAVPGRGKQATLHTQLVARDDSLSLYGFASEEERDLFLHLTSVSGIGPKVAVAILSGGSPRELLRAIAAGDAKRFQSAPGVGKRTAERLIVELREKIAGELTEGIPAASTASGDGDPRALAREGLMHLGYTLTEAEGLLDGAEGSSAEELINAALRRAAQGSGARP